MANKGGRPTKWDRAIIQRMLDYFGIDPFEDVEVKITSKNGNEITKMERRAARLPTFERFANDEGLHVDTLNDWAKKENKSKYPGFSEAYTRAKQLQKDFLITNGTAGLFQPQFTIFVAKNITDMKDKIENENTISDKMQEAIDRFSDLFPK